MTTDTPTPEQLEKWASTLERQVDYLPYGFGQTNVDVAAYLRASVPLAVAGPMYDMLTCENFKYSGPIKWCTCETCKAARVFLAYRKQEPHDAK